MIGIDIEQTKRFDTKDDAFLQRVFTNNEREYCLSKKNSAQHFCARFCAKEALIKALSDKSLELSEIEVLNDENGKPSITVKKYPQKKFELSLSHCKEYACAAVLVLGEGHAV